MSETSQVPSPTGAGTVFDDLSRYAAQPRVTGLALSPDGSRVVVTVAEPDAKGTGYVTAVWECPADPGSSAPARRLTRGAKGEAAPVLTPGGDLLFLARRPGAEDDDDTPASLWCLPVAGGEPFVAASRPGGLGGVAVARRAGTLLATSPTMPSTPQDGDDSLARKARSEAGVHALLHTGYPVRYWDHDLGPDRPRLLAADALGATAPAAGEPDAGYRLRDLTGDVGGALQQTSWDLADDGRTAAGSWVRPEARGDQRTVLVVLDTATGASTVALDDPGLEVESAKISPDGATVAVVLSRRSTPELAPTQWVALVDLERDAAGAVVGAGAPRDLTRGWDRWPAALRWSPDGSGLVVGADEEGAAPLFRVDVASGEVRRLTPDHGSYSGHELSPDGAWVYALRSAYDAAPAPVRVPAGGGEHEPLTSPVGPLALPGTLTQVEATGADGTPVRSYLALPDGAGPDAPAPLLLWIHGGPLSSWNAWSWRWNPWLMVARGYAVLLPDPALSTGYGFDFVQRGWGSWGAAPFTDLMAATDAAEARPDVDGTRTAAMGGSFGGYMANWVAGHTDRFDAVVTHASLWALDQFGPTTDAAFYWDHEMSPQMQRDNSPHLSADAISTPMLVIHGDKDYRVPVGEGLRLWWDLVSRSTAEDGSTPHRFLYFPDENHWVLSPGGATAWYGTVLAFLDQHVLGKGWVQPPHLG